MNVGYGFVELERVRRQSWGSIKKHGNLALRVTEVETEKLLQLIV